MRKAVMTIGAICVSTLLMACASSDTTSKGMADAQKPVDCTYGEADIRALKSEKVHASQQAAAGVSAILPIGLVANVAMGKEGASAKVATGDYNKMLDDKIAEIKRECGIK
jgi:hypothetical protein